MSNTHDIFDLINKSTNDVFTIFSIINNSDSEQDDEFGYIVDHISNYDTCYDDVDLYFITKTGEYVKSSSIYFDDLFDFIDSLFSTGKFLCYYHINHDEYVRELKVCHIMKISETEFTIVTNREDSMKLTINLKKHYFE